MGNYTIFLKFENPRRGRQARNLSENDPKILDLKSSSEQIIFRKLSLGAPELYLAIVKSPNMATVMGYYHWLKVHNSKNTRLRTWFLRWLRGLVQGQYLPSLIIYYVPVNKDFSGKIATTAVLDNLFWSGLQNDVGVAIATKWRHYLFYLQPYFSALGTVLPKSLTEAFSSNSRFDVCEV